MTFRSNTLGYTNVAYPSEYNVMIVIQNFHVNLNSLVLSELDWLHVRLYQNHLHSKIICWIWYYWEM